MEYVFNFLIVMTTLYKSHIAFIFIYALWSTENSAMAHQLKTTGMPTNTHYSFIFTGQNWDSKDFFKPYIEKPVPKNTLEH